MVILVAGAKIALAYVIGLSFGGLNIASIRVVKFGLQIGLTKTD